LKARLYGAQEFLFTEEKEGKQQWTKFAEAPRLESSTNKDIESKVLLKALMRRHGGLT